MMDDVIHLESRFVSWIKLNHSLFKCMDISLQNLLLQWLCHLLNVTHDFTIGVTVGVRVHLRKPNL